MDDAEIQCVPNEAGEPTDVIAPIEPRREIESKPETAYLLKSETIKQRLLAAKQRQEDPQSRLWLRNLESDPSAGRRPCQS